MNHCHKFKSEYEGNKSALVLHLYVDKIHNDWIDATFIAFYITFFFFFDHSLTPRPQPPADSKSFLTQGPIENAFIYQTWLNWLGT